VLNELQIALEIEAQDWRWFRWDLMQPCHEFTSELGKRHRPTRIPAELGQYNVAHEITAQRALEIRSLAVELALVLPDDCHADELAGVERRELAVDKEANGGPLSLFAVKRPDRTGRIVVTENGVA
jgi:hypothetical protein